jgi:hypothetical protein
MFFTLLFCHYSTRSCAEVTEVFELRLHFNLLVLQALANDVCVEALTRSRSDATFKIEDISKFPEVAHLVNVSYIYLKLFTS